MIGWIEVMEANRADAVSPTSKFASTRDLLSEATSDGTMCAAGETRRQEANDAMKFLSNCNRTAAESCDKSRNLFGGIDPLPFSEAELKDCVTNLTTYRNNVEVKRLSKSF